MHPCEPFRSGAVVHPTHIMVHPRVHRAHRLKSAVVHKLLRVYLNVTHFWSWEFRPNPVHHFMKFTKFQVGLLSINMAKNLKRPVSNKT